MIGTQKNPCVCTTLTERWWWFVVCINFTKENISPMLFWYSFIGFHFIFTINLGISNKIYLFTHFTMDLRYGIHNTFTQYSVLFTFMSKSNTQKKVYQCPGTFSKNRYYMNQIHSYLLNFSYIHTTKNRKLWRLNTACERVSEWHPSTKERGWLMRRDLGNDLFDLYFYQ